MVFHFDFMVIGIGEFMVIFSGIGNEENCSEHTWIKFFGHGDFMMFLCGKMYSNENAMKTDDLLGFNR